MTVRLSADPNQSASSVGFGTASNVPRWQLGWEKGTSVTANSKSQHFQAWCGEQLLTIESVCGEVGTIQSVRVSRGDGETFSSFGNWIEEAPTATNAPHVNVGDKVIWTNCPPQFTSWEPFLIVDIQRRKTQARYFREASAFG